MLLIVQLYTGCQKEDNIFRLSELNFQDVQQHENQWEQKKPKSYCINLYNSNIHYDNRFDICISDNNILSIKESSTQKPIELNPKEAITIENLFQFLKATNNSIYSGEINIKSFEITFDEELSYPKKVSFQFKRLREEVYKKVLIESELVATSIL
jgi:hypothetical protein